MLLRLTFLSFAMEIAVALSSCSGPVEPADQFNSDPPNPEREQAAAQVEQPPAESQTAKDEQAETEAADYHNNALPFDDRYESYCEYAFEVTGGGVPYRQALNAWYSVEIAADRVPAEWKIQNPDEVRYLTHDN